MFALKPNPARYEDKTMMVIGAGLIQEPAIRIAKTLGLKVVVVDRNPKAPGLQWADYPLLISTDDIAACIEAARSYKIDGVMSCGSEQGARTTAAVAEALNLAGIPLQVAQNATNKISIRKIMAANDIPAPHFAICHSREEAYKALEVLGLPVVVKPPDSHSSQGVSIVQEECEFAKALDYAARFTNSGVWVLEEYVSAIMHGGSTESFVVNGKVNIISTLSGKMSSPPFCAISCVMVPAPAPLPEDTWESVRQVVTGAVQAMGITTGPVHTQIHISRDGPRLIEIAPRLAGMGVNSYLIPLALGVNLIQATIDNCLGYIPDLSPQYHRGACQHYLVLPPGTVREVPDLKQFTRPELVEIKLFIKPGDVIPEFYSAAVGPGYVVTVGENSQEALDSATRLCEEIERKIVVK